MIKINQQQKNLIETCNFAFATSDKQGKPNVIAVGCGEVIGENKILITDNFMNKTRTNILVNNYVAIAVWDTEGAEGYQFKGTAEYFTEGEWKNRVSNDQDNEGLPHKGAILVTVKEIWDLVRPKLLQKIS